MTPPNGHSKASEVPVMLQNRLDESPHWADLNNAITAANEAHSSAEGHALEKEEMEHIRAAKRRLDQARRIYEAYQSRILIGDLEAGPGD